MKKIRCAIYTRKSSEEGLEQDFNSLDAQREACASYIASQKHEGWTLLPNHYDDGGISGGHLERPALQQLLSDVDDGAVDQIVVYKIDRLTRSLADFARLVDRLETAGASFVSVTQSFNTATSMGRLTLNVLLSFAQFEREVTAERIRDKIAASKQKGLWMGGSIPLGYDIAGRTLTINEGEAETVRTLFDLYEKHGTVRAVVAEAEQLGLRSKVRTSPNGRTTGGRLFDRGHVNYLLTNPVYAGKIRHKSKIHNGLHPAIIEPDRWQAVQASLMAQASRCRRNQRDGSRVSLLAGKLRDETGDRLTPSHTNKHGQRYRYYVSHRLIRHSGEAHQDGWRLPARQLEDRIANAVLDHLKGEAASDLLLEATADNIAKLQEMIEAMKEGDQNRSHLLSLINEIRLEPGSASITLDLQKTGKALNVDPALINLNHLQFSCHFQTRKRGVETRLILGQANQSVDPLLIRNIARAHHWYEAIKSGLSYEEIARRGQVSKHRIMQTIHLAFLSPQIVKAILQGNQPTDLTTKKLLRNPPPSCWKAQIQQLSAL